MLVGRINEDGVAGATTPEDVDIVLERTDHGVMQLGLSIFKDHLAGEHVLRIPHWCPNPMPRVSVGLRDLCCSKPNVGAMPLLRHRREHHRSRKRDAR